MIESYLWVWERKRRNLLIDLRVGVKPLLSKVCREEEEEEWKSLVLELNIVCGTKNFGQRCRWLLLGRESQFEIFLCVSIEMNLFYGLENKTEGITMIMHVFLFFFTLLALKNKVLTI